MTLYKVTENFLMESYGTLSVVGIMVHMSTIYLLYVVPLF